MVVLQALIFSLMLIRCVHGHACQKENTTVCLSDKFLASTMTNNRQAYQYQKLVHCTKLNYNNTNCLPYWVSSRKQFSTRMNEHYEKLIKMKNHSLNLMNTKLTTASKVESKKRLLIDVMVDTRCHHSWPYNPYHRFADCLIFILPSFYNYLNENWPKEGATSKRKIALVVDESTEMLCEYLHLKTDFEGNEVKLNADDLCLLTKFQEMLRTRYYYQCIKISYFHRTAYWYKLKHKISVLSNELIWLEEQKNPYAAGSGFMNEKHIAYGDYLKDFRRIMFEGFCFYCRLPSHSHVYNVLGHSRSRGLDAMEIVSSNHTLTTTATSFGTIPTSSSHASQKSHHHFSQSGSKEVLRSTQASILVLRRIPGTGRDIPQHDQLLLEISNRVHEARRRLARKSNTSQQNEKSVIVPPKYKVIEYLGTESICETMALFWSSKVVIGAHGAGIVNTVFSRSDSLLIEITPDGLESKQRGQPWRMNAPFAQSVGVSTHVVVIPHNSTAKSNSDIQKVCAMSLNQTHISRVGQILFDYLISSGANSGQGNATFSKIESLV